VFGYAKHECMEELKLNHCQTKNMQIKFSSRAGGCQPGSGNLRTGGCRPRWFQGADILLAIAPDLSLSAANSFRQ
jgi:hypothetical protein